MKYALLKLHIAIFLWGFTGVLGKAIHLNEGLLVWYRLLIAIISLYIYHLFFKKINKITKKQAIQLCFIGTIVALHWVGFYASIKYANVSIALVCLSSAGVIAAILEPLFLKKSIIPAEVILGFIALLGIFIIFHFDSQYRLGIIIGFISTLLSVLFTILNKKLVCNTDSKTVMFYELLGGFILLSILMPWYLHQFPTSTFLPSSMDWVYLIILSWVCTIVALNFSLQALQKISAFTQNLTLNLEPIYGIVLAFMVYKENKDLHESFYWGLLLIFGAVALQTIRILKQKKH